MAAFYSDESCHQLGFFNCAMNERLHPGKHCCSFPVSQMIVKSVYFGVFGEHSDFLMGYFLGRSSHLHLHGCCGILKLGCGSHNC